MKLRHGNTVIKFCFFFDLRLLAFILLSGTVERLI